MSYREEIMALEQDCDFLRKKQAGILAKLDELTKKEDELKEKKKQFLARKSGLAHVLLEQAIEELRRLTEGKKVYEAERYRLQNEIDSFAERIHSLKNDPKEYIFYQALEMAVAFVEYIKANLRNIGYQVEKCYTIRLVTVLRRETNASYNAPTGEFEIYDETEEEVITKSNDFYFEQKLYTTSRDTCDGIECTYSEWFKQYIENFKKELKQHLIAKYDLSGTFEMTIEDSCIRLELV